MFGYTQKARRAQVARPPTQVTLEKRNKARNGRVITLDPRVYSTPQPVTYPAPSERDVLVLREYKRSINACNEGNCACTCNCHSGIGCQGDTPRIHTPGHKPQYVSIAKDQNCKCPQEGTRHHHIQYCRDANIDTRFHERQPNTAHKGAHRECPKEGREHNRK